MDMERSMHKKYPTPKAPPLPVLSKPAAKRDSGCAWAGRYMWERLFDEGYRTDVSIYTSDGNVVHAHACILGMASPVMKGMLKRSKMHGCQRLISIHGVPYQAVRVFIRYIYSSCYEQEEMNEYVLHLLVLSHGFVVPSLKWECGQQLENGLLTVENVIDVFQLSLLCDAPRLSVICHHLILKNFKVVSTTEGWKVMKKSHPMLEKELLESMIDVDLRKKERQRQIVQRKVYLQLYEAMEALVHICRDGCRTIGPHDKVLKEDKAPCNFEACKGLELLLRHFAGCKLRVQGGCVHCKRMWQLLELHSRLCSESSVCRVPLCRNLKEKLKQQNKKDEMRWKILVKYIMTAKRTSGTPFSLSAIAFCA